MPIVDKEKIIRINEEKGDIMAEKTREKTKVLQIRIEEKLLNEFNEVAETYCVNKSALIRSWIERYVDRKRKINQCIEKASDLCYPFFISLRL